jgi:diketogulonate reductase-like aldo/keto reductase
MGESRTARKQEVAALRLGLERGLTLIDTAEMYGEGGAEQVVGEAIKDARRDVFLVSKVYPHNATPEGAVRACERSLERLQTDYLDVYLLHWRGDVPLVETLEGFEKLKRSGAIRDYGVSNFDTSDMEEAWELEGGKGIVTNQVLYNLMHRGIELDLAPWSSAHDITIMAYSPIEQGEMLRHPELRRIAARHRATPAQIALAWLLRRPNVSVVVKSASPEHIGENREALDLELGDEDLSSLDQAFPPPREKMPLEMR